MIATEYRCDNLGWHGQRRNASRAAQTRRPGLREPSPRHRAGCPQIPAARALEPPIVSGL